MPRKFNLVLKGFMLVFLLVNVMAIFHAYKFTHFNKEGNLKTDAQKISLAQEIKILFTGVSLPRPTTKHLPTRPYITFNLQSNVNINVWEMQTSLPSKGYVILFHGYGGEKSDMLDRAYSLLDMGYDVMLPDFMGAGGSEGNQCTIGFKEADNVVTCVQYLKAKGVQNIYLLGASMGAASIMHAYAKRALPVKGIILECPFGSMRQTVKNRFEMMHVPYFPMGDLLVFWGGIENGFNAFSNNPEEYAKQLKLPVLLMYGERDDRVKRFEIEHIYNNLPGIKTLKTFPLSGHESYLNKYPEEWKSEVRQFLNKNR